MRKRPLSFGSVMMLITTGVVCIGCFLVLSHMRNAETNVRMDARTLLSAMKPIPTQQKTTTMPTIKTTVVTLAPAQQPAATEQPAFTIAPETSKSVHLTVSGRVLLAPAVLDPIYAQNKYAPDFSTLFSALKDSMTGDLNVSIFDGLLTGSSKKYSANASPPEAANAFSQGGFDTLVLNHARALDAGTAGLLATADAASAAGLRTISNIQSLSVKGIGIAILPYCDVISSKGKAVLKENPDALPLFDEKQAIDDIANAKARGADLVIVFIRWENEATEKITKQMKQTAQILANAGADIILGIGPNTVLPVEMISTPDQNGNPRQTLTAYSLGLLLSDDRTKRSAISGALLHMTVTCSEDGVIFDDVHYTPSYIWKQTVSGKPTFRVLRSDLPAPSGMNSTQVKNMGNALAYIQDIFSDGIPGSAP